MPCDHWLNSPRFKRATAVTATSDVLQAIVASLRTNLEAEATAAGTESGRPHVSKNDLVRDFHEFFGSEEAVRSWALRNGFPELDAYLRQLDTQGHKITEHLQQAQDTFPSASQRSAMALLGLFLRRCVIVLDSTYDGSGGDKGTRFQFDPWAPEHLRDTRMLHLETDRDNAPSSPHPVVLYYCTVPVTLSPDPAADDDARSDVTPCPSGGDYPVTQQTEPVSGARGQHQDQVQVVSTAKEVHAALRKCQHHARASDSILQQMLELVQDAVRHQSAVEIAVQEATSTKPLSPPRATTTPAPHHSKCRGRGCRECQGTGQRSDKKRRTLEK